MRNNIIIIILVFICFLIENIFAELEITWLRPNLMLILVVFYNLFRGTRHSLFAAFLAGLLKDSYSANFFGLNIFSFICVAYLTTLFKMFIYHVGSKTSRVLLVGIVCVLNFLIHYVLHVMSASIDFPEAIINVLWPELFGTVLVTTFVFERFKTCVLRLS